MTDPGDPGLVAGFRSFLVDGYRDVDLAVAADDLANRLDDLLAFARMIRVRLTP